jgi:hypothetical protein
MVGETPAESPSVPWLTRRLPPVSVSRAVTVAVARVAVQLVRSLSGSFLFTSINPSITFPAPFQEKGMKIENLSSFEGC